MARRQWYSAAVVFEIAVAGSVENRSISLLLVRARDADEARREALRHAEAQNVAYANAEGESVTWTCSEVLLADELIDDYLREGVEVHSFFVSAELLDGIREQLARNEPRPPPKLTDGG